jgi:hypothetical protein
VGIRLMPHQQKAVLEMHNGSVLKGDVGTGKSITALAYWYMRVCKGMPVMPGVESRPMQTPKDVYVITTAKKRDKKEWEEEGGHFGVDSTPDLNGVRLYVDSWNNVVNYTDVKDAFFIFDEQRLVGNGTWVKAFYKIAKQNEWILLSATPGDNWQDYIPVFVANGFYKNRTEFLREHAVWSRFAKFPKIEKFIGVAHLENLRDKVLVYMPYARTTTRHLANRLVEYDDALFKRVAKDRWNPFTEEPIKDAAELFAVLRRITNEDLSRLGEIMRLSEKHPRLIVFYNFNYELDMLRTLSSTLGIPVAEWNGQKHQEIPEGDTWLYLVQYTAGAEGWNCIKTDAIAFWSLNYSWRIMEQSKGRIDRLNTPYTDLYYYVLRSESPSDRAVWRALQIKQTFNERKFAEKLWDAASEYAKAA